MATARWWLRWLHRGTISGEGNVSFFLSHRSWVTLIFADGTDATRGDVWELSGRLYDFDTVDRDGLVGFELQVKLDGNTLFTTTTGANGEWTATVPATMDLERGDHTIAVEFEGTQAHLSADAESTVRVWADLIIQVDPSSNANVVTRSDSVFEPILYTGSVQKSVVLARCLRTSFSPSETARTVKTLEMVLAVSPKASCCGQTVISRSPQPHRTG